MDPQSQSGLARVGPLYSIGPQLPCKDEWPESQASLKCPIRGDSDSTSPSSESTQSYVIPVRCLLPQRTPDLGSEPRDLQPSYIVNETDTPAYLLPQHRDKQLHASPRGILTRHCRLPSSHCPQSNHGPTHFLQCYRPDPPILHLCQPISGVLKAACSLMSTSWVIAASVLFPSTIIIPGLVVASSSPAATFP